MQISLRGKATTKPGKVSGILPCRCNGGFTLLETIVVVVLVGILSGLALTRLTTDSQTQHLQRHLTAFKQFYHAAKDEALLTGKPLRLRFIARQVVAEKRQALQWQQLSLNRQEALTFRGDFNLEYLPNTPIMLLPTGQSSPFQLILATRTEKYMLRGDAIGRLTEEKP